MHVSGVSCSTGAVHHNVASHKLKSWNVDGGFLEERVKGGYFVLDFLLFLIRYVNHIIVLKYYNN